MMGFKNIWHKRIPQALGFFTLVISITTIGWLSRNVIIFGTKATFGPEPKNIQITNISDNSFSVSYFTDDKVIGSISYGKDSNLTQVAFDDRDLTTGTAAQHWAHHFTITNLEPSTKYFFDIISANSKYQKNGLPYEIVTAPKSSLSPTSQSPLRGTVTLDNGSFPAEALVFVSSDTSQLLSAPVKPDGSYFIPLGSIKTSNLITQAVLKKDTLLLMKVTDPKMESKVTLLAGQTDPVPLIILSKNYDFSVSSNPLPATVASGSAAMESGGSESAKLAFPSTEDTSTVTSPRINTPTDSQKFKDSQPMFTGKALPNSIVEVIIRSDQEINTTVQADEIGNWSFRPEIPLVPGEHTITISAADSEGIIQTITRQFTVYAEGSQFTQPSTRPTQAPSPTLAPSPIASATPTLVPVIPTTTPLPTLIPSPTQTVIVVSSPPTQAPTLAPVPASGSSSMVVGIITVILTIGTGLGLFLLTRGASI